MIYLKNTTERQTLYIPRTSRARELSGNDLFFTAISRMHSERIYFFCEDDMTSAIYHKMEVELPENIESGEYDYNLDDAFGELSCGLLVIGDIDTPIEYDNTIEYEQY